VSFPGYFGLSFGQVAGYIWPAGVRNLDWVFWERVWKALQRVIALALFMAVHKGLDHGFEWITPTWMVGALRLEETVIYLIFLYIYCLVGWDMGKVFKTSEGKRKAEAERHENEPEQSGTT
jgi:hypothetical protein